MAVLGMEESRLSASRKLLWLQARAIKGNGPGWAGEQCPRIQIPALILQWRHVLLNWMLSRTACYDKDLLREDVLGQTKRAIILG